MNAVRIRLTKPTLAVLDVLLAARPDDDVWGLRICERADLGSGTVYPILERLARAGWVQSRWEADHPSGRPRRRLYQITAAGRAELATALAARAARRRGWTTGWAPPHGGRAS
jgi:DNA-binding MarR family transcriptional regulator